MTRRRRTGLLAAALAVALALPASALANDYGEVSAAFSAAGTGALPPCEFSSTILTTALRQAPGYDYQYQSDVSNAIAAALAAQANGACRAHTPGGHRGGVGAGATVRGASGHLPGSVSAAPSAPLPAVLVALFLLAAVTVVVVLVSLAVRLLGYDPRLLRALAHSLREAEYRIGAGWSDLSDRLRR
ncbi:hypothetical protein [Conexibacter sp. DBS9H8]|uniref:hypothetical protein n=1 Tax=Conexibacter sp. DBS9H8 TaxID=2937801 RepID=UPI00200BF0F7|nr:hypothetical protein [Conexibacter sp. DBS9H8]